MNMAENRKWIQKKFLQSFNGSSYSNFSALYFSGLGLLDLLTPQILAGLTVNSDALNNVEKISQIINALAGRNASDVNAYLTQFVYNTQEMNITIFQNSKVRDLMLSKIMQLLEPLFSSFTTIDYIDLIQTRLFLLLPSIIRKVLAIIPTNISCESYQAIVQSLNDVYLNLSKSQRGEVYKFSKNFLSFKLSSAGSLGIPCASNTNGTRDWLLKNFHKFMTEVSYPDLLLLNKNFSAFEILDLLSALQLSGLTLKSLNNTSHISMIIDALGNRTYKDLIVYITQFVNETQVMNIKTIQRTTRDTLLRGIMRLLQPQFERFSTTDYVEWFQTKLYLLLPSITTKELAAIPRNISCESFQAILKGLDNLFLNFTFSQCHEISIFGKTFLNFQLSLSGSLGIACSDGTNGTREWIINNFFRFMTIFNYSDFTALNKNFSGFEVLDLLSPQQLSALSVTTALNNTDKISQILEALASRSFSDLAIYMTQINRNMEELGITAIGNTRVRHILLSRIMELLILQFPTFKTIDYIDWFQTKLCLLLPSITKNELDIIPINITCRAYQAIVEELDKLYLELTTEQHKDIFDFITGYLTHQLDSTETACTVHTNGSMAWLLMNFGRFRSFLTYNKLQVLNKNFIGLNAIKLLSVSQLGELSGNNGTLKNSYDVQQIFKNINADNVIKFIDAFRTAVNQTNVVFAPGVHAALLGEVLNLIQSVLSNASSTELQFWFGTRLKTLLPGLNASMVPSVFVTESCNGSQI
ncbi:uncharacterized protein, partial [Scyliorhinus torazame]